MWSIILVPGLLQIRDYALAMYDLPGIDQDQAAATVDVYMDRQSAATPSTSGTRARS
jgi:hypothetical protein